MRLQYYSMQHNVRQHILHQLVSNEFSLVAVGWSIQQHCVHSGISPQNIKRQHPVLQLIQLLFMSSFFFGSSSAPVCCCQYYNGRVLSGFSTYDQNNNNSCCWAWLVGQGYRVFNLVSRALQTPYKISVQSGHENQTQIWAERGCVGDDCCLLAFCLCSSESLCFKLKEFQHLKQCNFEFLMEQFFLIRPNCFSSFFALQPGPATVSLSFHMLRPVFFCYHAVSCSTNSYSNVHVVTVERSL